MDRLKLDVSQRSFELLQRALSAYLDEIVKLAPGYAVLEDHDSFDEAQADYYHGANLLTKLSDGRSIVEN